jgi:transcriptional regulator with XRE-family HTH domain
MINDKEKFCNDLKEFFRSQGLTQQNIAERFGVSQQYVAALLNGTNSFGKRVAQKWAAEFGLNEAWLLTGVGDITTEKVVQQNNLHGDNFQGEGMTVNNNCSAEYLSLLKKKDEQIDQLLDIIKKMQN